MAKDFVQEADKVIEDLKMASGGRNIPITTSQIRQIMSMANIINNKILQLELKGQIEDVLPAEIINLIKGMEVKLVYQAGRDPQVKNFVVKSKLREEIKNIGSSREKFKEFFSYMEALVAFHRFHGGKE